MPDDLRFADHGAGGQSREQRLTLTLYVAGTAPNSKIAEANLRRLLNHLDEDYSLDVVDCLGDPMRALRDGILVTPTLVKVLPEPQQTVVGTLGDSARLASLLEIDPPGERSGTHD